MTFGERGRKNGVPRRKIFESSGRPPPLERTARWLTISTWTAFLLFSIALLTLPSGCQKAERELPFLHVGHAPHDHHSPLYIAAMNEDFFRQNGGIYLREVVPREEYLLFSGESALAKIVIHSSTGGKELIRKLSEKHFDLSFGGIPAMLSFIDREKPIKIVSPVMSEGAGLVLRTDLPASNWEEFLLFLESRSRPVRIGYKIAVSVQNLIFERALDELKVPYSTDLEDGGVKVALVNMHGAKNLIPGLENGIIDGFVTMQPFLSIAEHRGSGKVIAMLSDLPPEGKWKSNPCCALAIRTDYLEEERSVSEAFVTLMMRANRYISENSGESAAMVAEWLGVERGVEEKSIPTIKFKPDIDEAWSQGVDFWIESMIQSEKLAGRIKEAYERGEHRDLIYDHELYRDALNAL